MRRLAKDADKELLRLREEWGETCQLKFGSQPVLLVNSPRVARELLGEVSTSPTHWTLFSVSVNWYREVRYTHLA